MANFTFNGFSTTQQTLLNNETGLITQNGALAVLNNNAVVGSGSNELTVLGTLAAQSTGSFSAYSFFGTHTTVNIGTLGNVSSRGSAILASGTVALDVNNAGTIMAGIDGLVLVRNDASVDIKVHNSGLIDAVFSGLTLNWGSGAASIVNTGQILGRNTGIFAFDSTGNITIVNSGEIIGKNIGIEGAVSANQTVYNTGLISGLGLAAVRFDGGTNLYDGSGGRALGTIHGGSGVDTIIGGDFTDKVSGGGGSDEIDLGGGKDIFLAGNVQMLFTDNNDDIDGGDGIDTYDARDIISRVVINLNESRANGDEIGLDHIFSFENIRGGGIGDILVGDAGRNVMRGGDGNDSIAGLGGDDRLIGGEGNDSIRGGDGRDVMTGGLGIDIFAYNAITEIGSLNPTRDSITDFVSGTDEINLSVIDANSIAGGDQAFSFIGIGAFTNVAGQLRYVTNALNQVTVVQGDINGDSVADFQLALFGDLVLAAGDFIL